MVARQAETAREIIQLHGDPLSLEAVEHYFRLHYWSQEASWDKHGIVEMFDWRGYVFQFREAAAAYRVIEEQTTPIIVPYSAKGHAFIEDILQSSVLDRTLLRRAQRFTVSVHPRQLAALEATGACDLVHGAIHVLNDSTLYDTDLGLAIDAESASPERFIA